MRLLDGQLLRFWAVAAGFFLWIPAWAVPLVPLPVQVLDLWIVIGLPLGVVSLRKLGATFGWVIMTFVVSVGLCFAVVGGEYLILAHAMILALGFILMMATVAQAPLARTGFVKGFLWGSAISTGHFLAQFAFGAQRLDFRTNVSFSLPEQYGRGFALFPEVSTFSTHAGIALSVVICLLLAPSVGRDQRYRLTFLLAALVFALLLSRSTSFLVITPVLCVLAVGLSRKLDLAAAGRVAFAAAIIATVLAIFFTQFYADRLETSAASRSAAMRLASILGGLSPLWTGEVFGVGLGHNHEILRRAFDIGRSLDLSFGQLPKGVNSQIIARIFEEGWPAVIHFAVCFAAMIAATKGARRDPVVVAICLLAVGSFLTALMVTGYRGIYTNWLWIALPAGLLASRSPSGT